MKKILSIVATAYFIMQIMANVDGSLNFLNRFKMTTEQINITQEWFKIIANIITVILVVILILKFGILYEKNQMLESEIKSHKNKISTLKWFRDKEMIRVVNHYNANFKIFEDRVRQLEFQLNKNRKETIENPLELKNTLENQKQIEIEIVAYNKAFEDWNEIIEYGLNQNSTIYKTNQYGL